MLQPDDIRNRLLVARLPALPQALIKLLAMCQSDDVGMPDIVKLLAVEPALTSRVLSVAGSAAYRRDTQQLNLLQAANMLGTELIKVLVISESVFQTFNAFSNVSGTDLRGFWKHSLTAAVICKELAKRLDYAQPDEAYLAGLLHDVGRLALLAAVPQQYRANFLAHDDATLSDVEQQTLMISHAEAGAWLTRRWHLDAHLVESILYHHEDMLPMAGAHPLVHLVHLTHRLVSLSEVEPVIPDDFECDENLTVDDLTCILQSALIQVEQTARDMGIDISGCNEPPATAVMPAEKPAADPAQVQLAQEIRNRTLLTEMSQTLARQPNTAALLLSIRQHAGILLQLEDALIMLMRENQQTLVPVSMNDKCRPATSFFAVAEHPALAECAQHQKIVFTSRESAANHNLLDTVAALELVCIPLISAKRCLGIIVAPLLAGQLAPMKAQTGLIQAFGIHAGSVLSHKTQAEQDQRATLSQVKKEQLIHVKKLAHEVNNPISVIKNYLEVIDNKLGRQEAVTAELSILGAEVDRVGKLVNNFSHASRPVQFAPVDANRLVRDMVQLLTDSKFFPNTIQISCELPEQANLVRGSADMIKQIMLNLIKNARECMPEGGQIAVGGGTVVERNGQAFTTLSVTDTGPGLSAEVQAHLFKPVKSTKPGENRGLGLSIVNSLVLKMGGAISCKTAPTGASFTLLLPCIQPAQIEPTPVPIVSRSYQAAGHPG